MTTKSSLFQVLNIDPANLSEVKKVAKRIGMDYKKLKFYHEKGLMPTGVELKAILEESGLGLLEFQLKIGAISYQLENLLSERATEIAELLGGEMNSSKLDKQKLKPVFETKLGKLYQTDCIELLKEIPDNSVDLIFADPPFNLNKFYLSGINDELKEREYLEWSEEWLTECCRILSVGGSFFVWNLPKWNIEYGRILNRFLNFRHWIATDIKYGLPISGRLYPSHYGLLYYVKGKKPDSFSPDRLPMDTCSSCYKELKDYGGYKNKMNPLGINISDIWYDIPPVRHSKYKRRKEANELSVKLLDRIIEMASKDGDVIFDPFGGSGTTYAVAEIKNRKWIGVELGPTDQIIQRFEEIEKDKEAIEKYRASLNTLFPDKIHKARVKRGIWTPESFIKKNDHKDSQKGRQEKLF